MLSKRYESTEVDRRTWLHVSSGTHWSTSSDTHQVVEIQKETSTKMYTPFCFYKNVQEYKYHHDRSFKKATLWLFVSNISSRAVGFPTIVRLEED